MHSLGSWLLLSVSITAPGQQFPSKVTSEADIMLVGVSRDDSMFKGGISGPKWTGKGTVVVEPIARITATGNWTALPCDSNNTRHCVQFARSYLNKPHSYTVVSANGTGAQIQAAPVTLGECSEYDGTGSYKGATIGDSAIAASTIDSFSESAPLLPIGSDADTPIRKALATLIPRKLDSLKHLRLFSLDLQGQRLVVVQRAFADYASPSKDEKLSLIFAIGTMDHNHFKILHWKQNTEDEDERVLGTLHLKSGQEFLLTVVSDPESQSFRVYGIQDNHLKLIFAGGGSSC